MLDLLNGTLPDGLWLMEIKQSNAAVTIEGRAMSQTSVSDYAKSLQDSGFFKMPVEVVMTLMETVEETNVFRFLLKAVPVATVPATVASTTPAGRPGV
jgi:Tfp pilus assembly protein PilN